MTAEVYDRAPSAFRSLTDGNNNAEIMTNDLCWLNRLSSTVALLFFSPTQVIKQAKIIASLLLHTDTYSDLAGAYYARRYRRRRRETYYMY